MGYRYTSSAATCPFYALEESTLIQCEGLEPGSILKLSYKNSKNKQRFVGKYCHGAWENCPIAQMLEQKHEGGA